MRKISRVTCHKLTKMTTLNSKRRHLNMFMRNLWVFSKFMLQINLFGLLWTDFKNLKKYFLDNTLIQKSFLIFWIETTPYKCLIRVFLKTFFYQHSLWNRNNKSSFNLKEGKQGLLYEEEALNVPTVIEGLWSSSNLKIFGTYSAHTPCKTQSDGFRSY